MSLTGDVLKSCCILLSGSWHAAFRTFYTLTTGVVEQGGVVVNGNGEPVFYFYWNMSIIKKENVINIKINSNLFFQFNNKVA